MEWLTGVYIATTIFGVGVTIADLIGVFSNLGSDDGVDDVDDGDFDDTDSDSDAGTGDDDGEHDGSIAGHDRRQRRNLVIALLSLLRTAVYFSLGFGPVGWFATTQYQTVGATLAWSLPVGAVVAVGTRALRAFMRRDLSSTINKEDLLMERGRVTVSIGPGQVGRVRVNIAGVYVERYAKADAGVHVPVGSAVRVVDVDDEYVYVELEGIEEGT